MARIDDIPLPAPGTVPLGACARFLLGEARLLRDSRRLVDGFATSLREEGIPIDRLLILMPTLHPLMAALNFVWTAEDSAVREVARPWGSTDTAEFKRSPIAHLLAGTHGVLRRRICDPNTPRDFGILDDLERQGCTDYLVAAIAPASGRLVSAVSWSTRAPGGFTDEQAQRLLATLAYFAPLLDTHAAQRVGGTLLNVYLGADAGARVLQGAVKRGEGEDILAAVCFTDLRDFTVLSDQLSRDALLELLNSYFDCVVGAVHQHGGEVLKFIGDAVLAVFRASDADHATACQAALRAARDAFMRAAVSNGLRAGLQPIDFGMSIHIGHVMYGNIGGPDRLDFTVIGPAVNLASRIQGQCRVLSRPLLVSEEFAVTCGAPCDDLGEHHLKGVARPVRLFSPS